MNRAEWSTDVAQRAPDASMSTKQLRVARARQLRVQQDNQYTHLDEGHEWFPSTPTEKVGTVLALFSPQVSMTKCASVSMPSSPLSRKEYKLHRKVAVQGLPALPGCGGMWVNMFLRKVLMSWTRAIPH